MSNKYSSGKNAIAMCDVCGFQYKLSELKANVVKNIKTNILACPTCWDPDHPQLSLGLYPVDDPQAVQNPRPDTTYYQAGKTGLQLNTVNPADPTSKDNYGTPSDGSRIVQWGWNPVGLFNPLALADLPDTLQATGEIGTVTVTTS